LKVLADVAAASKHGIVDMVFADPPYRLSNGGITCKSGRVAPVDKGAWDRSRGLRADYIWNRTWLSHCQGLMKPDATMWVTGTQHVIFLLGFAMRDLGMKILNVITWEKPDPPPNLSGRYFTHSTELLIWAGRDGSTRHRFNDGPMRQLTGGQPMQTVWRIAPPGGDEKRFGRHPTQKPLELVRRAILAATTPGEIILDPFIGSGTTAVAALETGRQCVGLDDDEGYLKTAARRIEAALRARARSRPIALAG
jgi:site-specific DNA-methyltransferase (adenine-specific)